MPAEPTTHDLAPLLKTTTVELEPARAFELFTAGIHRWWPLVGHSVFGERAVSVAFEPRVGGRIFETRDDGEEADWGAVTAWEPPARVAFSWHPGRDASTGQEVEVRFTADGDGTRVELEHRDWHKLGAAATATRSDYDSGWDPVLALYRGAAEHAAG